MDLIEVMRHRRSIRKYTEEAVFDAALEKILQATYSGRGGHPSRTFKATVTLK